MQLLLDGEYRNLQGKRNASDESLYARDIIGGYNSVIVF